MRESFGGTFMIWIMMVFVVLIVSFTAVVANIVKTFRIKNQLINYVELYNYDGSGSGEAIDAIEKYFEVVKYQRVIPDDPIYKLKNNCVNSNGKWFEPGFCITTIGGGSDNGIKTPMYFKVTVYATVSLPFFDINMPMPVSGESKTVVTLD